MFRITIEEVIDTPQSAMQTPITIERYTQTVDTIDMRAVMAAVNKKPRKSRAKSRQPGTDAQPQR